VAVVTFIGNIPCHSTDLMREDDLSLLFNNLVHNPCIWKVQDMPFCCSVRMSVSKWSKIRLEGVVANLAILSWRNMHNHKSLNLYCLPIIIRIMKSRTMRYMGYITCMGEMKNVYRILVKNLENMRPLWRHKPKWV